MQLSCFRNFIGFLAGSESSSKPRKGGSLTCKLYSKVRRNMEYIPLFLDLTLQTTMDTYIVCSVRWVMEFLNRGGDTNLDRFYHWRKDFFGPDFFLYFIIWLRTWTTNDIGHNLRKIDIKSSNLEISQIVPNIICSPSSESNYKMQKKSLL